MIRTVETEVFRRWLKGLRDRAAAQRINVRIIRLRLGNPGDVVSVGEGVSELRLDFGPGYRVYFASRGTSLIVLLAGGDKSSQRRDIERAKALWQSVKDERDG